MICQTHRSTWLLVALSCALIATPAVAGVAPPAELTLTLGPLSLRPGAEVTASLTVRSRHALRDVVIQWSTEGAAAPAGTPAVTLGDLSAGELRTLGLRVRLPRAGHGLVAAELSATLDGAPFGQRADLYLLIDDDTVRVGDRGFGALDRERLHRLHAGRAGDPAAARALERLLGAGAFEVATGPSAPSAPPPPEDAVVRAYKGVEPAPLLAPGGTVTVHGTIQWRDAFGAAHAAPYVSVEIHDEEAVASDVVRTTMTDVNGNYTVTIDNDDGLGQGGRDIFVRAVSRSGTTRIDPGFLGRTYNLDSSVHPEVADGADLPISLLANNSEDNNTAFSVLAAVVQAELAVYDLLGTFPAGIQTNFPSSPSGSYFQPDTGTLNIDLKDRFDWDVIHHEYCHSLSHTYGLDDEPGGTHSLGENLAERLGKSAGLRLAWGEGLATYLGISLQRTRGMQALGIPNVGDTGYDNTENATFTYDLEGVASGRYGNGEDNEVMVQRILYDLYDADRDDRDEIALGALAVWQTLVAAKPHTLSAAWNAFATGQSLEMQTKLGAIFADWGVAPELRRPNDGGVLRENINFEWEAHGGGPTYPLNRFSIEFYSPDLTTLRHDATVTIAPGETPRWQPTPEDRALLQRYLPLKWIVRGTNTASPQTGDYVSPPFTLGGVRLGFTVDDTGSMGEEIGSVRAALTRFVSFLATEPQPPGIALVTFKDAPSLRIASDDLAQIQAAVDGLGASGGGDCPEGSVGALALTADTMQPGGVIFFDTDADPLPGSDMAGTIAKLRARRIRVEVLLSGSCTEEIAAPALAAPSGHFAPEVGDDHGDNAPGATTVGARVTPFEGVVAPAGDRDYFSFAAIAGTQYRLEVAVASGFDSVLTAYDTNGTTALGFDDDGGANRGSLLAFTAPADGTYFVAVGGFGDSTGSYRLVVSTGPAGGPTGAIQAYAQLAAETGGVFVFLPGVNAGGDPARRYESAALDIMIGSVAPAIPFVEPASVPQGATLVLTVHGLRTNFSAATVVAFAASGITVGAPTVRSATRLEVPVQIAPGATLGFTDVTVTTPLGAVTERAVGHDALQVTAPPSGPTVTGVVPGMLTLGERTELRVFGINTHFDSTSVLALGPGVTVGAISAPSPTELRVQVAVATDRAALGYHNVSVTTGGEVAGESVTGPLLVIERLAASIPRILGVSPAEGRPGAALTLRATGENTHFAAGVSTVELSPEGVGVSAVRVLDPTTIEIDVQIDPGATLGFRDLVVTTGGEAAAGLGVFAVTTGAGGCTAVAECDDAEPCTENQCADGRCTYPDETGIDAVLCAFGRSLDAAACSGQPVPAAVGKRFAKARSLVERAAVSPKPKKAQKLLKKAAKTLTGAVKQIGKAERRKKKALSAECAAALRAVVSGAQQRVQGFQF